MVNIFLPLLIASVGLYLLVKLRFFFVIHPLRTAREIIGGLREGESRRSLALALAGTLGVGNIFGVAAGIMIGGAGCVFWIFLSSLFSMTIKYAETILASEFGGEGGTAETVRGFFGDGISFLYALLTLALALLMGGRMQAEALCDVAESGLGIRPHITALILLILLSPCVLFGVRKIEKITEILIPVTTIIYIIMCFAVIFTNLDRFNEVIYRIMRLAFTPTAALGGVMPIALREGFSRGILSNEAGIGSSATAHVRGGKRTPHLAGLFGILEVFFDTTLLCTLSGVVILLSVENPSASNSPMSLVTVAFISSLGPWSSYLLVFLILSFAYATIICWYFYGVLYSALYFYPAPFKAAFLVFLLLPIGSGFLLSAIDLLILLMSLITLSAIIKGKERIITLSQKGLYKSDS